MKRFKGDFRGDFRGDFEQDMEGDTKGDFRGDFKQDMEGDTLSSSGQVQVWYRLEHKFSSLELDSEVGRLVILQAIRYLLINHQMHSKCNVFYVVVYHLRAVHSMQICI